MANHSSSPSLSEVHQSVDTTTRKGWWRKLFAFMGPAYLISVGYMDPGNWATDLAGGSQFGYQLIWVLLMSNLMALLLQSLSARLGIVRGLDLAQASRETYPKPVNIALYILAEVAIAATDLAEVLGMAIGLQLLFDLPLLWGVVITIFDSFILIFLMHYGIRKMEAFIIAMVSVIGLSFLVEMMIAKPDVAAVASGLIPSALNDGALYIAIGIIGATVMPHNLYLHSALVQTRKTDRSEKGIRRALRFNTIDSTIALNLAFLVNSAILILAATTFYKNGWHEVAEIQDAHRMLQPLLGTELAPILFAVALIASGQSSTITGTLAGQIVMEGYINLRIQPWIRRILTRLIAIVPALIAIIYFGESATGELLVLSQVILSLQLGFAIIPLIHFVSDKEKMGPFVIKRWVRFLAWCIALVIVFLNGRLVVEELQDLLFSGEHGIWPWFTLLPVAIGAAILLVYVVIVPFVKRQQRTSALLHESVAAFDHLEVKPYQHIAVAVDFGSTDSINISHALRQGGETARYTLIHVVESAGALVLGRDAVDFETREDVKSLHRYAEQLRQGGFNAEVRIEFGNPKTAIPNAVTAVRADLLVMGAHGHSWFKDLVFGTTVNAVRHRVKIPVLIVR